MPFLILSFWALSGCKKSAWQGAFFIQVNLCLKGDANGVLPDVSEVR
jgi:hypothetical protein